MTESTIFTYFDWWRRIDVGRKWISYLKYGLSIGVKRSSDLKSSLFVAKFDSNGHKSREKSHNDLTKKHTLNILIW